MSAIQKELCRVCKNLIESVKENSFYPFCSERCKSIDLGRWFSGEYNISEPVSEEDLDELAESESDTA